VAEQGCRSPYWQVSPNGFGGQINASPNGDMPGDIYRLIGGVVRRPARQTPAYAGYMANAFIIPKGTKNNRVIAPGAEDMLGPTGGKERFFLVSTRPGMVYEQGDRFAPAVQVDPMVDASITYTLTFPNGKKVVARGVASSGSFVGKDKWTLDQSGVYHYQLLAEWQKHMGAMPGLPPSGGVFYVIEKDRPQDAPSLTLDLPVESKFRPAGKLTIRGHSTADQVSYAAVIPGAVVVQADLPVKRGTFEMTWDPAKVARSVHTYDITNLKTGNPLLKDVVHITFFAKEKRNAQIYHSFARIILRGNSVLWVQ
jgi:hypothetical protein